VVDVARNDPEAERQIVFDVADDGYVDIEKTMAAAMARD
jgi:hypothetical protein